MNMNETFTSISKISNNFIKMELISQFCKIYEPNFSSKDLNSMFTLLNDTELENLSKSSFEIMKEFVLSTIRKRPEMIYPWFKDFASNSTLNNIIYFLPIGQIPLGFTSTIMLALDQKHEVQMKYFQKMFPSAQVPQICGKNSVVGSQNYECFICQTDPPNVIFNPCNHLVCCSFCASKLDKCPYCQTKKDSITKIYFVLNNNSKTAFHQNPTK